MNTPRAFTLIEVLVVVAISVVLMLATTELYLVYGKTILFEHSKIEMTLGGSSILDTVRTAGLQADHVLTSHVFSGVSYTAGASTALFEIPSVDASGAIIPNSYDYIGISASGTNVYLLTDAAVGSTRVTGKKLLSETLDSLTFTFDTVDISAAKSIMVSATTSAIVRGVTTQNHFTERLYLRNI